ncbi:MAG: cytochrome b [Oleiphilaceae bacterium]|nr:cytochrome b [Oleiphilaceae bacterium]
MPFRNTPETFGWVSIVLHWGVAIVVFALFGVGLYMVDLSYYHSLYQTLPHWHRSAGLLLSAVVLLRLTWRFYSPPPEPLPSHSANDQRMAALAHWVMYLLLVGMFVSGYLMSTADGRGIKVFDWFQVPSVTGQVKNLEDWAGDLHYWLAWTLMGLVALHAAAAIKHHFVDRDSTLRRMLGLSRKD